MASAGGGFGVLQMTHLEILIFALVLDALIGEPENLWHRIPHPAALMGHAISR